MPRAPTLKQIKTVQLINQGYTTHRAMKEAGYSKSSLKQSYKFKKAPMVQNIMLGLGKKLKDKGITEEYLSDKFIEWLEAKKITKFGKDNDYDTQIKAYRETKEIFKPQGEQNKGLKRKLTIEEFVSKEESA